MKWRSLGRGWREASTRKRYGPLKEAEERDIGIGGPELAGQALAAGLVDEIHLLLVPVAVGGGKPALPLRNQLSLELQEHQSFGNGTVYLHYRVDH
jgi:dihydrofolate reductase